jgi:hypothetical protein
MEENCRAQRGLGFIEAEELEAIGIRSKRMLWHCGGEREGSIGIVDRLEEKGEGGASIFVEKAFIAVACNRVVGAASWGSCNLVAFGAHRAVAIFSPEVVI